MQKLLLFLLFCFFLIKSYSQIGIGTNTPNSSAILEIKSSDKGILIPRLTSVQRLAIQPVNGLMAYDLDSNSLMIVESTSWKKIRSLSNLESLIGGGTSGDVLQWDGVKWAVVSKCSLFSFFYYDKDGDGYGDSSRPVACCIPPLGFVTDHSDCDDNNAAVHPGATEICNGIDDNCNGQIDEGCAGLTVTKNGTGSGVVSSSPTGVYCGPDCGESFALNSVVTLTAIPTAGSTFSGWTGACTGTGSCTVTMDAAKSVTATFAANPNYTLTVTRTGSGTVTTDIGGIYCGAACSASYSSGASVTLTAVADPGYTFTGWGGACTGSTPTCTVNMNSAKAVTATFVKSEFTLSVATAGSGTGIVSSNPSGVYCGADCSETFSTGTVVTLSASASGGSTFSGWTGACTGTGSCTVTMDAAKSVTATFAANPNYTLTVTRTGSGTVTTDIGGIYCGAACSASYSSGASVTLTAVADPGYTFTGWGGACTGSTPTCTVNMNSAKAVTATFVKSEFTLSVATAGSGTGIVSSNPSGVYCGADCSETFSTGTLVTLSASASGGSTFSGWTGACTGTGSCTLTMDAAKSVTATFAANPNYTLTVTRTGSGTVTTDIGGIYCGAACSASYSSGASVTLTAVADPGYTFTGWGGACTGTTPTCTVNMNSAKTVTATFVKSEFTLSVATAGSGTGIVSSNPSGVYCGADCSETFSTGTLVTLSASASGGSTFSGWTGACTGTGSCTVTMDAAKSVTATFAANPNYTLTVTRTGSGTVTTDIGGIYCGAACSASYSSGASVTLTAVADPGYTFTGWGGACTGTTPTCTVNMNSAKTVTATFVADKYSLFITKSGAGDGTVSSTPAGISCGGNCGFQFNTGTVVSLSAVPDAYSTFAGWTGACTGTGLCSVTMDAAKNVGATFNRNKYGLLVTVNGSGSGIIFSSPGGIYCGADCNEMYDAGTTVTLTPTATAGSIFAGWTGACSGAGACNVTMDAAKNVTATFNTEVYLLTVNKTGLIGGTVTSTPAGINCGASCSNLYSSGTVVTLIASPNNGGAFLGWSGGGCTGTGSCVVTMNAAKTVTANFQ